MVHLIGTERLVDRQRISHRLDICENGCLKALAGRCLSRMLYEIIAFQESLVRVSVRLQLQSKRAYRAVELDSAVYGRVYCSVDGGSQLFDAAYVSKEAGHPCCRLTRSGYLVSSSSWPRDHAWPVQPHPVRLGQAIPVAKPAGRSPSETRDPEAPPQLHPIQCGQSTFRCRIELTGQDHLL